MNTNMNKHTPDIEGIVEEFDAFLDKFTGKHEKDNWLKQSLYADTVQVRKDLIVKEFQSILQSQADQYEREKGEMMEKIQERIDYVRPNAHKPEVANEIGALLWCKFLIEKYGVDLSE